MSECKHKDAVASSHPAYWYNCTDCGAHLNIRFEEIPDVDGRNDYKPIEGISVEIKEPGIPLISIIMIMIGLITWITHLFMVLLL